MVSGWKVGGALTDIEQRTNLSPELLCPLKHPAELAEHPTLSIPFLDSALPNLVQTTEEKLRQERANLWRAKNLHRQLIGDENWMPCKSIETADDWDLFEPRPRAVEEQRNKRKRDEVEPLNDGVQEHDHAAEMNGDKGAETILTKIQGDTGTAAHSEKHHKHQPIDTGPEGRPVESDGVILDVEMQDASPTTNGMHIDTNTAAQDDGPDEGPPKTNGDTNPPPDEADNDDPASNASHSQSPPPPSRRITRALAAENAPTPPLSLSPSLSTISSSLLTPDPLFLLPHQANRTITLLTTIRLPIDELLETRRLLSMYIQKQEETIRSTEAVLGKLIKAKRLKDKVWEWCKAEGHVGELSDGEDWIDGKEWGLGAGELRKGKDEEDGEDEVVGVQGKKGRRRRVRARDGGD